MVSQTKQIADGLTTMLDLVEVIRRKGEGVAETVEALRLAAQGQRALPGMGSDEDVVGVPALERRVAELETKLAGADATNADLRRHLSDAIAERDAYRDALEVPKAGRCRQLEEAIWCAVGVLGDSTMGIESRNRRAQEALRYALDADGAAAHSTSPSAGSGRAVARSGQAAD